MLLGLKNFWQRFEEYQQKRADYIILKTMTDRELHDIGLSRGSIREAIYGETKEFSSR
jgi:uncharacterized protein YjiS (DUF1127 family)